MVLLIGRGKGVLGNISDRASARASAGGVCRAWENRAPVQTVGGQSPHVGGRGGPAINRRFLMEPMLGPQGDINM